MRKLTTLALAATMLFPAAAMADVSRGEIRRDRADVREERAEYRDAVRSGSPRDVREERGEYRDAVREYREDVSEWRDERRGDRRSAGYGRPDRWNAPFAYRSYRAGGRAHAGHYGSRYVLNNPWRYGLSSPRGSMRWVRHYDDALLIDMRTGMVRRVVPYVFG